jgi:parvulin-like peptidyl-prolyl isomerase
MPKSPVQKSVTKKHQARLQREQQQRRYLTIGALVVLALVVLVILYGVLDQTVLKAQRTVASVNGEKITLNEFQSQVRWTRSQMIQEYSQTVQLYSFFASDPTFGGQMQQQLQQMAAELAPANADALGQDVLDAMIEDELIRQQAAEMGITVTEEEIDERMQALFGYYPDGTPVPTETSPAVPTSTLNALQQTLLPPTSTPTVAPTSAESPTPEPTITPTATLTATPTQDPDIQPSLTPLPTEVTPSATPTEFTQEGYEAVVDDFVTQLAEIDFTEAQLRQIVADMILKEKVGDALTADMETVQEQVWARHILVMDEVTAAALIDRMEKGESFADLAAEASLDTANAASGGDLGWFTTGVMDTAFEEAAFDLEIGQVSEPVQSQFGWHVIQVLGKEERPLTPEQIGQQKQGIVNQWIEEQKAEANIEQYDNWQGEVPVEPQIPPELQLT